MWGMSDCLFCKISDKQIPASVVYEDADVLAFRDISPKAPTHILIIPRKHITSLATLSEDDEKLAGHILFVAKQLAQREGLTNGFRTVFNAGSDGGQTVFHLHLHLLGGRALAWPPG